MKKICCIFPAFVFACLPIASSHAVKTVIYYKGGAISIDNPEIPVNKVHGIRMSPLNASAKCATSEVWIPFFLENLSNDTNNVTVDANIKGEARGWSAELVEDRPRQMPSIEWENRTFNSWLLGEGSSLNFSLKLKRPGTASLGDIVTAEVRAVGSYKGSHSYVGYNGIRYGGEGEIRSVTTVVVE